MSGQFFSHLILQIEATLGFQVIINEIFVNFKSCKSCTWGKKKTTKQATAVDSLD